MSIRLRWHKVNSTFTSLKRRFSALIYRKLALSCGSSTINIIISSKSVKLSSFLLRNLKIRRIRGTIRRLHCAKFNRLLRRNRIFPIQILWIIHHHLTMIPNRMNIISFQPLLLLLRMLQTDIIPILLISAHPYPMFPQIRDFKRPFPQNIKTNFKQRLQSQQTIPNQKQILNNKTQNQAIQYIPSLFKSTFFVFIFVQP